MSSALTASGLRDTRLRGVSLVTVRIAWAGLAAVAMALAVVGYAAVLTDPGLTQAVDVRRIFDAAGLDVTDRGLTAAFLVVPGSAFVVVGVLLALRRSDDWMVLLLSMALLSGGPATTYAFTAVVMTAPRWAWAAYGMWHVAAVSLLLLLCLFPNGRFVPRWTRWVALVAYPAVVLVLPEFVPVIANLPRLPTNLSVARTAAVPIVAMSLVGLGVYAQVYRYRRVSTVVERQQARWVAYSLGVFLLVALVVAALLSLPGLQPGVWMSVAMLIVIAAQVFVPVAVTVAVQRHRLYDIDRIISRTVSYALLTGLLVATYLGVVFALQGLLRPITGESQLAVAGATLAVAALFGPARRRLQTAVDRRFNRARYDAQRTVEEFRARLRDEVDLGQLGTELVGAVRSTVAPAEVSLWLRPRVGR